MSRRPADSPRVYSAAESRLGASAGRRRRRHAEGVVLAGVILAGAFAAGTTRTGSSVILTSQRFLEFHVDVFALVALTSTVAAGLIASDRIIMTPGNRIVAQAIHRALALLAMAFLATHIVLEVLEGNARLVDAAVPFLDPRRTFYVGLGTLASDLLVVIAATGIMRRRFTGEKRPGLWKALHWTTYAAWPMAIVHGLLAGRHAKPYVDWSYGACMAAVGVALVVRAIAEVRPREARSGPSADGAGLYLQAVAQAAVQARLSGQATWQGQRRPALPPARPSAAALPARDDAARPVVPARIWEPDPARPVRPDAGPVTPWPPDTVPSRWPDDPIPSPWPPDRIPVVRPPAAADPPRQTEPPRPADHPRLAELLQLSDPPPRLADPLATPRARKAARPGSPAPKPGDGR